LGDIFNVLISGIEGQGINELGYVLRKYGLKVPFIKNIVGTDMQNEGNFISTVRYLIEGRIYSLDQGYQVDELISSQIPINDTHLFIGLEPLETMRNLQFISEQTIVIMNTHRYYPKNLMNDAGINKKYPTNGEIIDILDQLARQTISLNFNELSKLKLDDVKFAHLMILGTSIREFREIFHRKTISAIIKKFYGEASEFLEAFNIGYGLIND